MLGLLLEPGHRFGFAPARASQVLIMLVAVFLQTAPHVPLRLVTAKCSRSHDLLLKAGATRVGMIMLGGIPGRRSGQPGGTMEGIGSSCFWFQCLMIALVWLRRDFTAGQPPCSGPEYRVPISTQSVSLFESSHIGQDDESDYCQYDKNGDSTSGSFIRIVLQRAFWMQK
jgi:hypothetical protein